MCLFMKVSEMYNMVFRVLDMGNGLKVLAINETDWVVFTKEIGWENKIEMHDFSEYHRIWTMNVNFLTLALMILC